MSPRKITSIIEIQFSLYKKSFPYAAPEIGFVFFQTLLQKNALVAKFVIKDGLVATIGISWNVLIKKSFAGGRQLAPRSNMTGITPWQLAHICRYPKYTCIIPHPEIFPSFKGPT